VSRRSRWTETVGRTLDRGASSRDAPRRSPGAARQLASWSAALAFDHLPTRVADAAKLHLLDTVGTALAALGLGELHAVQDVGRELGGRPEATALGLDERVPAAVAALVNGTLAHALDYDDTHELALVHASAVIAPTVLACGEAAGSSGEEVVAAAVAGYEVSSRVALAGAGQFQVRGFHPTSVCGVFGAAAAAGALRRLDAERTAHALGIAGSLSSGLMEFLADGSQTKPLHAGWAAHAGVVAAALAARGATGPATVLEGRFGLLRTHLGRFDAHALVDDLGTRWETLSLVFKPYPACHCAHTCLDALAGLVAEAGLGRDDVDEVVCRVPGPLAVEVVLEPAERKARPATPYEAKFSLPYCLAALLVRGELGVESFTEQAIGDREVLELAERVRYEVAPFPKGNDLSGGVAVITRDGRRLERAVLHPRGGRGNPMDPGALEAKFRANAALALPGEDVDRLLEAVECLERRPAADMGRLLAGARRRATSPRRVETAEA
jgi:2-methylcitrate dehydratase PrpD